MTLKEDDFTREQLIQLETVHRVFVDALTAVMQQGYETRIVQHALAVLLVNVSQCEAGAARRDALLAVDAAADSLEKASPGVKGPAPS